MAAGVLEQVRQCPLESDPIAPHGHCLGRDHVDRLVLGARSVSQLVQTDELIESSGRLFPRKRQQVVRKPGQTLRIGLEFCDELLRSAVPREVGDVAEQRGQRCTKFMRRVREETALRLARARETREHRVQCPSQTEELVA